MQQIQIIGNLGEDAQIRDVNNQKFVSFRVACTEKKRDGENLVDVTTWYSCSMNRVTSKIVDYLVKGAKVFVQGLPTYALYDSATFHCKMIDVRIFVDKVQLCDLKREISQESNEGAPF